MIDIAIIGCGPAGLSAGINARQRGKEAVVFGYGIQSSPLYKAKEVDNHAGMEKLSGKEMLERFLHHAQEKGVSFVQKRVIQIFDQGDGFLINAENEFYEAKTVVLALGMQKGKPMAGEEALLGKGVSYCATCDGMLYRGKTVVLIGQTQEAEEDLRFLSQLCQKVYYLPEYSGFENILENVTVIKGKALSIEGEEQVSGFVTDTQKYSCDGVFIIRQSVPLGALIYGLEINNGHIQVNQAMQTNLSGVFAAGDCVGLPYQVSKAVGEGLIAAQQAAKLC